MNRRSFLAAALAAPFLNLEKKTPRVEMLEQVAKFDRIIKEGFDKFERPKLALNPLPLFVTQAIEYHGYSRISLR